jgi:hypothetical protein
MLTSPACITLLVSLLLVVAGAVSLPLFPQPFITFYCSTDVCLHQSTDGIPIGYVLLLLGILAAVIGGIMGIAARSRKARRLGYSP